jgi:cell wall-associated NlpC family hydrolase
LHRDDRVTTATLPHGHSALRSRRSLRPILAIALAVAGLPALAANPAPAKAESAPITLAAATAAPAPVASLALPAPAAIATPDTAPLAAQLEILQKAKDAPETSSLVRTVLQRAFALLGTPYRWGGNSPERGFDCSGLVGYVFRTIGIDLPRVSRAMADEGTRVANRDALAEGDLVFFGKRGRIDHVGIYIGDGKFLHAPRTGRDVTVSSLTSGYWSQKYLEARRLATGS